MKHTTVLFLLISTIAQAQVSFEIRAGYGTKYSRPVVSTGFQYHFNECVNIGPDLIIDVAQQAPASIGLKFGLTKSFVEIGPAIYWQMYGQSATTVKQSPNKFVYSAFIKVSKQVWKAKMFIQYQYIDNHQITIGIKEFL